MQEIDLISDLAVSVRNFVLSAALWEEFDPDVLHLVSDTEAWGEVKLFNTNGQKNPLLHTIPDNTGGVYILLIKPNLLPDAHLFLMYVGRTYNSKKSNLRQRCSQYTTEKDRPKIKYLIEHWRQYLYIRYLPLDDEDTINRVEAELINKILPPCNDQIPNKRISAAVKAFIR